jgi:tryptophan synthase alpha chain
MSDRLRATFARLGEEGRGGLSVYLPAGHPSTQDDHAYFDAAIRGGADFVELGIPFSDPAADGPVIEAATARALRSGTTVAHALHLASRLRNEHADVPILAMTYANVAYRMGWDAFASALAHHGLDGCILPDVPLEESGPVRAALATRRLAWVPLVTPTTPAERMKRIAASATGFLYVVANVGITGQDDPGPLVEKTVARARGAGVPLAVGFGIRTARDVRRVLDAGADAAIVGSALVQRVTDGASPDDVAAAVRELLRGTRA